VSERTADLQKSNDPLLAEIVADTERGRGPAGTAIRTGTLCWNRDILTDPQMAPWRAEALKRQYASSIALPLMYGKEAFGVLGLYAAETDAFNENTIEQFTDLANNLAFGVIALRTRQQRRRAEEALRESEQRLQGLNVLLENRVLERTSELVRSNEQLVQAQAGLRESEARFSAAFRASPALMTISRLSDEKYIEANDAFIRWYGLRREDIIGHATKELGAWLNPEDRARFWADLRRYGSVREFECRAHNHRGVGTFACFG
jgi:PAS domain S-box-containing protein